MRTSCTIFLFVFVKMPKKRIHSGFVHGIERKIDDKSNRLSCARKKIYIKNGFFLK